MRTSNIKWLSFSNILVFGLLFSLITSAKTAVFIDGKNRIPGEVIVRFKTSGSIKKIQASTVNHLSKILGSGSILSAKQFLTDSKMTLIRLKRDADFTTAMNLLTSDSNVEFAEPNFRIHAFNNTPNDPDFMNLWGLKNIGQKDPMGIEGLVGADINVLPVWQEGHHGSRKTVVAIIDTGIEWAHPDLAENIYTNPGEAGDKANNGIDDDGNGFVDDVHGWSFVNNTNNSNDDKGHGSHCAGTIGGVGNNGIGVVGVNWEVAMLPIKFLDDKGDGETKGAIESINYARLMKVKIMSNSWGGQENSPGIQKAIEEARDAGILFVVAAGNTGELQEAKPNYPASYSTENIISVAASDNKDMMAYFSTYSNTKVHVAAPGLNIFSTVKGGKYATMSGTSMAAPHVAGAAALLWSANPEWSYLTIKNRLIETSEAVLSLKSRVIARGRINAYNALHGIVTHKPVFDESKWKTIPTLVKPADSFAGTNTTYTIHQPGAKYVRVHFSAVHVDPVHDHLRVLTSKGEAVDDISGPVFGYYSEYVEGDTLLINLKSADYFGIDYYGFKVDQIQYID